MRFLRANTTNDISKQIDANQFLLGQKAALNGDACPEGATDSFCRGYASQYELEQILEVRTRESVENE